MTESTTTGNRLAGAFARAKADGRIALMPFVTVGYPTLERSKKLIKAIVEAGADGLELGVPFSDPLADGVTVQRTSQQALDQGTNLNDALTLVAELRAEGVDVPLVLMGYTNPFYQYGLEALAAKAAEVGIDGFIVPDLPPEEAAEMEAAAAQAGLAYVHLLAPTSSPHRIITVTERARGFIYLVSVTGVTGARQRLQSYLDEFVGRVRERTDVPLAVGFGISTPEQAAAIGRLADGVIVGSALINAVDEAQVHKPAAAAAFVRALRTALEVNEIDE